MLSAATVKDFLSRLGPDPTSRQPSIANLMWVTASIGLFMALTVGGDAVRQAQVDSHGQIYAIKLMLLSMVGGVAILSPFWFRGFKKHTGTWFPQPGFWLIALLGIVVIQRSLMQYCYGIMETVYPLFVVISAITGFAAAIIFFFVAAEAMFTHTGFWRVPFAIAIVSAPLVGKVASLISPAGSSFSVQAQCYYWIGIGVTVATAAILDLSKKEKRHWIHWLGVTVALIYTIGYQSVVLFERT